MSVSTQSVNDGKTLIEDQPEKKIRVVCVSDTHGVHNELSIPDADVFIHGNIILKIDQKRAILQSRGM
jgi:hypothetical protein